MENALYNLNIERAVLSSILFEPSSFELIGTEIKPEVFYLPAHQHIFRAMEELSNEEMPIDEEFIRKRLSKEKLFNEESLLDILATNPLSNTHAYLEELKDLALKRDLIRMTTEIKQVVYEEQLAGPEALDRIQKRLFEVNADTGGKHFRDGLEITESTLAQIAANKERGNKMVIGLDTGFYGLNKKTSGFGAGDLIIIAARPSMGKCLGKGTKVLMYSGELKNVEDVVAGDRLMGDDSTPRTVRSIARGREKMYWVRQNKGIDYRVNESHILSLKRSRNEGGHTRGEVLNITVAEYLQKSAKFKTNYKGYKVAVDFPQKTQPIDPYFLGLWLGDGRSQDVRIAVNDSEIKRYLESYAKKLGLVTTVYEAKGKCPMIGITSGVQGGSPGRDTLQKSLRDLGVLENKHIPHDYLCGDRNQRLNLLAGLIDSDGYYDDRYHVYEVVQKNEALAKQIKFLADTLGFRASIKAKKATLKSRNYEETVYRVRIVGALECVPVLVERKKARPRSTARDVTHTGITVEYDCVDDYYGFEIDGNRLFLLEDMTVTHNTAFVLNLAANVLNHGEGVAIFSLEMPAEQLMLRMLAAKTSVPLQHIKLGNLNDDEWQRISGAADFYAKSKIFVDDDGLLTLQKLRSKLRRLKLKHPEVKLAIIDYLQLMTGSNNKDRHQEVSDISRGIKMLARELEMPILALSQLNRGLESRHDKRPMLADIRESGAIEQDADMIMFVYREDVYKAREEREKQKRAESEGKEYKTDFREKAEEEAEIIIAKHRNGETGTVKMVFQKAFTRFVDADHPAEAQVTHYRDTNIIIETVRQPTAAAPVDMPRI
ncbi:MAG: replicative DNA helicase [Campylobacterales bacterium]